MIKHNKRRVLAMLSASALTLLAVSVSAAVKTQVQEPGLAIKPNIATDESVQHKAKIRSLLKEADPAERYIVTFKSTQAQSMGASQEAKNAAVEHGKLNSANAHSLLKSVGAKPLKTLSKHRMVAASMNKKALNKLLQNAQIESVSIDAKRYLQAQSTPYGISMVQGTQLVQSDLGARKVCIIDTGYNLNHPDLPDQNGGVTGQGNNTAVGNWYNDGNGHGTHVAGTISALANNEGVVGVYPGVDLHIVKIFDDSGNWTFASDLIGAIDQCQNAGANIVNMSLGGGTSSAAEKTSMQGFVDDGIMLVAAAGNAGNSSLSYPASYSSVISVAAVDSAKNRASYSQYNSQVEIAGPGSSVLSTWPTNTYNTISGTSMATPHVVGAAALVWSFFPQCTNQQIRGALNATAEDKGAAGRDNYYGNGIIKAKDAYDYLNTYGCSGDAGGGGGGSVEPVSGQITGISKTTGNWQRYTLAVPTGATKLTITTSGGSGDGDLYLRLGAQPSTSTYDCRPYLNGNNETCTFTNPGAGTWHIGIRAYSTFSGVTMDYSYQ